MGIMKYQFDSNSNGDIVSSPDRRDPEELRKIYEYQKKEEEEDCKKSREIADKIVLLSQSAPLHEIRVGRECSPCPVIEICDWWGKFALLGGKCFPVKYKRGKYVLDLYNSMGVAKQEIDLLEVIKRYLHYDNFSYRFL